MVDEKKIGMTPAVEISYLKPEEQQMLLTAIDSEQATPSLSQAQRMKKLSRDGKLNDDTMLDIMMEQKKPEGYNVVLSADKLRKYFPRSYTPQKMEETILKLLDGRDAALDDSFLVVTDADKQLANECVGTPKTGTEALQAAEKGYKRLMDSVSDLARVQAASESDEKSHEFVAQLRQRCYDAMNDDLMTPAVISVLIKPGATALTSTLRRPSSRARARVL